MPASLTGLPQSCAILGPLCELDRELELVLFSHGCTQGLIESSRTIYTASTMQFRHARSIAS